MLPGPSLHGDIALQEGFGKLGHPEFSPLILFLHRWQFLRPAIDAEFTRYHQNWICEHQSHASFVAEAWIYCLREWRDLALKAAGPHGVRTRLRLFVLMPEYEVYRQRRNERLASLNMPRDDLRTAYFYHNFMNDLQLDGIEFEIGGDEELLEKIPAWLA
jgi:hypothetical protein